MWTRTGQPGLWFTGGAFSQARIYSRFIALQIDAIERGRAGEAGGLASFHLPHSSFRDGPKDQTRNLEIPGSCFARPGMTVALTGSNFLFCLPIITAEAMRKMPAPLDPVVEKIIPLLPLRDADHPDAAERARVVAGAGCGAGCDPAAAGGERRGRQGEGRRRLPRGAGLSDGHRRHRRRSCSSMAAAGSPAISTPMTARRAILRSKPARWWSPSITAGRPRCVSPAPSRMPLRRCATWSSASPNSAATAIASAWPATAPAAISRRPSRSRRAMPASSSPRNCSPIPSPT